MNSSSMLGEQNLAIAQPAEVTADLGRALWLKIVLARQMLNLAAQHFWTRPDLPRLFPRYLLELHSMMRCAVPLLMEGYQRAAELGPEDALAAATAVYLHAHIAEEMNHDVWLLEDMESAGIERHVALAHPPCIPAAQLVGAQYCWMRHAHPAALFGYLAVLEVPPNPRHLDEIQAITGLPPQVFRCLRLHAEHDVDHSDALQATIELLPLTPATAALISTSALATMQSAAALLEELAQAR